MHGSYNKASSAEERQCLLCHDTLNKDDWDSLLEVMSILKKFYELTKRAEGTKLEADRGVLSDYMTTLNEL